MTEIYDYLSEIASDVDITLSVSPQIEVQERSYKDQEIHHAADGSTSRKGFSEDSIALFKIQYRTLTASDAGTIFDIYNDTAKADGLKNSFKFVHPDGHTYVVKFAKEIPRDITPVNYSFNSIDLIVLGKVGDAAFVTMGGKFVLMGGRNEVW